MMKKVYVKLLFLGVIVVLLIVSLITYNNLVNYTAGVKLIRHSNEIIKATELALSILKDAETGQRGFQLTGDTVYLQPYYSAIKLLPGQLKRLDSLVRDSHQEKNVDSLKTLVQNQFLIIANILSNIERSGLFMDRYENSLLASGKRNMDAIRIIGKKIVKEEDKVFDTRVNMEGRYKRITPVALLFYTLFALLGIVLLFIRILQALDKSKEAETLLSENLVKQQLQNLLVEERKMLLNEAESLAQMGSWKWTEKNDEMVWSDGLYKIFDKKPGDRITWETFLGNVFHEDKPLLENFIRDVKAEKKGSKTDYRIIIADQIRHVSVTAKPQHVSDAGESIMLGAVLDISESKLYEKQLQQNNAELKRSNEDLEQFAYVASHDLQEPLRKIRAFGDRLTTKFGSTLTEQGTDYIVRMQAAAARMQLLIEDLLSFSRVSRAEAKFELLEPSVLIQEVLEDIDLQVKNGEAIVRLGSLPRFYGDKPQIKRLFQNLISNAVKFRKTDEKPVIDISGRLLEKTEMEGEMNGQFSDIQFVRVSIKDNGIGFDEKYTEKIFNIFQRLNGRTAYAGTGIGLAICRKIVANHHGYISAKSIEDVGSEFIVTFPKDIAQQK